MCPPPPSGDEDLPHAARPRPARRRGGGGGGRWGRRGRHCLFWDNLSPTVKAESATAKKPKLCVSV